MQPEIALDCPVKSLDFILFVEKRETLDNLGALPAIDVHKKARHEAGHLLLNKSCFPSVYIGHVQLFAPRKQFALDVVFIRAVLIEHGKSVHP